MGENDKPTADAAFLEPGSAPVETEADAYKVWRLQKGIAEGSEIPSGQRLAHCWAMIPPRLLLLPFSVQVYVCCRHPLGQPGLFRRSAC